LYLQGFPQEKLQEGWSQTQTTHLAGNSFNGFAFSAIVASVLAAASGFVHARCIEDEAGASPERNDRGEADSVSDACDLPSLDSFSDLEQDIYLCCLLVWCVSRFPNANIAYDS
jgi:hypothetical protein